MPLREYENSVFFKCIISLAHNNESFVDTAELSYGVVAIINQSPKNFDSTKNIPVSS